MKNLFKHVRDNILHGMVAGLLATKDPVDFDIGMWQHKLHGGPHSMKDNLVQGWCSKIINLLVLDKTNTKEQLYKFIDGNDFKKFVYDAYLVYFIAVPTEMVDAELTARLAQGELNTIRFSQSVVFEGYTIFVNDFIKNILYI